MPAIPATQETEAGESFEPGRQRLQLIEIVPLYSSLGDRVRLLKTTTKLKSHFIHTVSPLYSWVPYPWIQPTTAQKFDKKKE